MNCVGLETQAFEYLDGTLGGAERAALQSHLSVCNACSVRLREFSSGFGNLQAILDAWPSVPASRSFDGHLFAKIGAQSRGSIGWWNRFVAPFVALTSRPAFAGAFSAVLLAALTLIRFFPAVEDATSVNGSSAPSVVALDSSDEVALVQSLTDLDDMELLRNFEVLQEMKGPTP
jgi:anti-sigma factor RsiW